LVFIDTSAWIAFANELDKFHKHANPLMRDLIKNSSTKLFTSDVILGEILDIVSNHNYKKDLVKASGLSIGDIEKKCKTIREMLDRMIQNTARVELLHADEKIIAETKIYHLSNPHIWLNFSDWSTISFMKQYNIKKLFTYDKDFEYLFQKRITGVTGFEAFPTSGEIERLSKEY